MQHVAEEKLGDRLIADWVSGAHLHFANDEARKTYQARAQLIIDTIRLKDTGKIPVIPAATQKFALDYGPVTFREAMTEFDKAFAAYVRQYEDTDFDAYIGPEFIFPAGMFEALAWNRVRLPGVHLPDDKSFQFVEAEYMKAEEYDEYLDDPSDWILRKYLPRLSPRLEPLAQLPPLRNMVAFFQGLPDLVLAAAENPGMVDAMKALQGVRRGRAGVVRVPRSHRPGAGWPAGPPPPPGRDGRRAVPPSASYSYPYKAHSSDVHLNQQNRSRTSSLDSLKAHRKLSLQH